MRYFVDPDTHWDIEAYWNQLHALESRLTKPAYAILSKTSFHDAEVLDLQITNLKTLGSRRRKDPTEVVIRLWHPNQYVYTLTYGGVTAIDFGFDWRRQSYIGPDDQEHFFTEDRGGLHDWLYDELTAHDHTYLQHEIHFASAASLLLVFRRVSCSRSQQKRRYRPAQ